MRKFRNACRILAGIPQEKGPIGWSWRGWKTIKTSLKNAEYKYMEHRIGTSGWSCEVGTDLSLWLKAMYMLYIRPRKYSSTELISTWYLGGKTEQFPYRNASVGDFSTVSCCSVSAVLLATSQSRCRGTKAQSQTFWLVAPVRKCGQDRISGVSSNVKINVRIPEGRRQEWLQNDHFSPVQKKKYV